MRPWQEEPGRLGKLGLLTGERAPGSEQEGEGLAGLGR